MTKNPFVPIFAARLTYPDFSTEDELFATAEDLHEFLDYHQNMHLFDEPTPKIVYWELNGVIRHDI